MCSHVKPELPLICKEIPIRCKHVHNLVKNMWFKRISEIKKRRKKVITLIYLETQDFALILHMREFL